MVKRQRWGWAMRWVLFIGFGICPLLSAVQAQTVTRTPLVGTAQARWSPIQPISGTWQPALANIAPAAGFIKAATVDPQGNLYLSGAFTQLDGVTANGLIRWDGTTWSALPSQTTDWTFAARPFQALTFLGNTLYAAGDDASIGGLTDLDLARWDGTQWSSTGSGVGAQDEGIEQIATDQQAIYLLGHFQQFNDVAATNLVRWDGTTVTPMTTTLDELVTMVATSAGVYISGGTYEGEDGFISRLIFWDGAEWHPMPMEVELTSLRVVNDQLYGVQSSHGGNSRIVRWTGTAWVAVSPSVDGIITEYTVDGTTFYLKAVDGQTAVLYRSMDTTVEVISPCACGTAYHLVMAHHRLFLWNGTTSPLLFYTNGQWQAIPVERSPGLTLTAGGDAAYLLDHRRVPTRLAVDTAMSVPYTDTIRRWTTTTWEPIPVVNAYPMVDDFKAAAGGSLYVLARNQVNAMAVYRYQPATNTNTILPPIPAATIYGLSIPDGSTPMIRVSEGFYRWTGTSWMLIPNPPDMALPLIREVSYQQQFYATYVTRRDGSTVSTALAQWDGQAWQPITTITGTITAITANPDGIFMVGAMTMDGVVYGVTQWDGQTLHGIALHRGEITTIAATDGGIYVGGGFNQLATCQCFNSGYWDGTAWQPLNGGTNGVIKQLVATDKQLFAYGTFTHVDTTPALGLALWSPDPPHAPTVIYLPVAMR